MTVVGHDLFKMSLPFRPRRTLGELRALRALIPPSIAIIVGGAGVAGMEDDLGQLGIHVGRTLRDLRDALARAAEVIDRDAA